MTRFSPAAAILIALMPQIGATYHGVTIQSPERARSALDGNWTSADRTGNGPTDAVLAEAARRAGDNTFAVQAVERVAFAVRVDPRTLIGPDGAPYPGSLRSRLAAELSGATTVRAEDLIP